MMPSFREISGGAMVFDGGTIILNLVDSLRVVHQLRLVQHIMEPAPDHAHLRGSLYLDDVLIQVRSSDEAALLTFLRTGRITASPFPSVPRVEPALILGEDLKEYFAAGGRSPAEGIGYLVNRLVTFVDSDEYVCFGVQNLLTAIESEEDVRVLLAVEAGTRARGLPSRDSSFDIRFIYINRKDWYSPIEYEPTQDAIERPINDVVNLRGWDVKRALQMLAKLDPQIIEWISSPTIYMQRAMTSLRLRDCQEITGRIAWISICSACG